MGITLNIHDTCSQCHCQVMLWSQSTSRDSVLVGWTRITCSYFSRRASLLHRMLWHPLPYTGIIALYGFPCLVWVSYVTVLLLRLFRQLRALIRCWAVAYNELWLCKMKLICHLVQFSIQGKQWILWFVSQRISNRQLMVCSTISANQWPTFVTYSNDKFMSIWLVR
mgnify:CR=1 FL=1